MSHFAVMVINDSDLNEEALEPIMAPWHEYECTGVKDQYVVDVDVTDEITEQFNRPVDVVVLADGKVLSVYDDSLYVEKLIGNDPHHKKREQAFPEGAVEQEMPADEARKHGVGYKTLAEAAEDWCGGVEKNGRFYRQTNPNAKWDWWQLGGRWSGMLRLKGEVREALHHIAVLEKRGKPVPDSTLDLVEGVENGQRSWMNREEAGDIGQVDVARKCQIDFDGMRQEAENNARASYMAAQQIINGRSFETWEEVRTRFKSLPASDLPAVEGETAIDAARKFFHDQPVIEDLSKAGLLSFWSVDEDLQKFRMSIEEVAERARSSILLTHAVIKDGKWYQKGEMGWFGMSSNDKDPEAWSKEFAALLDGLPDDTSIAIVDCHI